MSTSPEKHEWLVIIPDKPNVQELRLKVRPEHIAALGPKKESGLYKMGGGLLNDLPPTSDASTWSFHGSTLVVLASSRDEVVSHIKGDVYTTSGVWDADKAQIYPFKCAFRLP